MQRHAQPNLLSSNRNNWMRQRTFVVLRWVAILGQITAILIASLWIGLDLPLELCLAVIGISVALNIVATILFPANNRLSEKNAFYTLSFDLLQLAALLYLTGGLSNPFSVLLLAPVIVSASTLSARSTALLGTAFVILSAVLLESYIPLQLSDGTLVSPPRLMIFGSWVALTVAVVFLAIYARRVAVETYTMSEALTATRLALGREQQLTALGGVVAAAAHELGTPLATIKLVARELADELSDMKELSQDAELIASQADRCRDILRGMGRRGKDDILVQSSAISVIVEEAAEPHIDRGKQVHFQSGAMGKPESPAPQPEIRHMPELIHGLRNLIQNAVDFSSANVWIDVSWDQSDLRITISDDGSGYPPELLGRIGDPFLHRRTGVIPQKDPRKGYEGMGLGLFIAKTLLEGSGADISFDNAEDLGNAAVHSSTGAVVTIEWKLSDIVVPKSERRGPLGDNQPFTY